MSADSPTERRAFLPLVLLHLAAASVCFAFFLFVPIIACLISMAIANDPGGPMFFPIFVIGVFLFAMVITIVLGGAALLSDLLRRRYRVPVWLPPLAVFALATASCWLLTDRVHPAVPMVAGGVIAVAFVVHWAAVSTVWFLPRFLFRLFRVHHGKVQGLVRN